MTRVDIPTLKCDRCKLTTQDLTEMAKFMKLESPYPSEIKTWDLCPVCRKAFVRFMNNKPDRVDPDFEPLGEDVTTHTMYMSEPPHDDGRWCAWHHRLQAWAFYNPETGRRDLKCLRTHEKEF